MNANATFYSEPVLDLKNVDRQKFPRNARLSYDNQLATRLLKSCIYRALARHWQMTEFANLIPAPRNMFSEPLSPNCGKKEFWSPEAGAAVSKPPLVAYSLTLCHCADFLVRFEGVTCGQVT